MPKCTILGDAKRSSLAARGWPRRAKCGSGVRVSSAGRRTLICDRASPRGRVIDDPTNRWPATCPSGKTEKERRKRKDGKGKRKEERGKGEEPSAAGHRRVHVGFSWGEGAAGTPGSLCCRAEALSRRAARPSALHRSSRLPGSPLTVREAVPNPRGKARNRTDPDR
jgi:hypothetical protein